MADVETKTLIADLWKAGFKKEARAVFHMARKGVSGKEMELQMRIFSRVLDSLGIREPDLRMEPNTGLISFEASDMGIVEFPRFLERLLLRLNDEGTRKYKLDHVNRTDPMRVFIQL